MAKFTIIVPCYNIIGSVDKLFEMLTSESYTDYEVVFVDDCSKDGTFELMLEKQNQYSNYIVVQTPKNGGPGVARNHGLIRATGKYVLFCDSDDYFDISCINKIDDFLCSHEDADLIVCPHILQRGKKVRQIDMYSQYAEGQQLNICDAVNGNLVPWGKIYKKSIIDENGLVFPARMLGEDVCFVVNYLSHVEKAYKMDLFFYTYIMNDNSVTHSHVEDWRIPTTFEILLPLYQAHFPEVEVQQFIEGHLMTKAKLMSAARCKNRDIKEWFIEETKRYPDWYPYTKHMDRSFYRRLLYRAMCKCDPVMIKIIMFIRKKLY